MAVAIAVGRCFMLKNKRSFQVTQRVLSNTFITARKNTCRLEAEKFFCVSSSPPPSTVTESEKDALCGYYEKLFLTFRVQHLLSEITGFDANKIFQPKQGPLRAPRYKFMTDEELKQAQKNAEYRGHKKLKMPAYIRRKATTPRVISKDPEIQGLIPNNLVCVDISPGIQNWTRVIVVREPDGILREATHNERARVNQIYFPKEGREIEMPSMFQPEHLEAILKRGDYMFVLDRACCQFELDDQNYSRVTETTFRHIDQMKKFDDLRSTRHFGPMAFYLVIEKNVEGLMVDMIERLLVDDAVGVVEIYCLAHSPEKWEELKQLEDKVQILKVFANEFSTKGGKLELVVQSLKEHLEKREQRN